MAAGVAALAGGLGACGSSALTSAPTGNAMTITAYTTSKTMGYRISGSLRPGFATITFKDQGPDLHMMATVRVKPGVTAEQIKQGLAKGQQALAPLALDDPNSTAYGVPTLISPGQSTTVTAVGLKAGHYASLCFVPDEDGTPHALKGMTTTFDVVGSPYTTAPKTTGTITIQDHHFVLPTGFNGQGTYRVTNSGSNEHSFDVARLDGATTVRSYVQHVNDSFSNNKPPNGGGAAIVGGIDNLQPGQSAYLTMNLAKGHYGYASTDGGDGPNSPLDVTQGLAGQFDVG